MSVSMDDKLVGEKAQYYCSSSEEEDEEEENEEDYGEDDAPQKTIREPTFIPEPEIKKYEGTCTNVSIRDKLKYLVSFFVPG